MLVTLEELFTGFTGKEVIRTEHGFAQVLCPTSTGRRGALGRWLPVRAYTPYSLVRRVKLAWGVLTGRYDAFSWEIKDDVK